jgi:hypothetical protein
MQIDSEWAMFVSVEKSCADIIGNLDNFYCRVIIQVSVKSHLTALVGQLWKDSDFGPSLIDVCGCNQIDQHMQRCPPIKIGEIAIAPSWGLTVYLDLRT